jgi:hypothetical protein
LNIDISGINRVKLEIDGNDSSSMSPQINAEEAWNLAKDYANKAGYAIYYIEEVTHEPPNWTVRVTTLMSDFNERIVHVIIDEE